MALCVWGAAAAPAASRASPRGVALMEEARAGTALWAVLQTAEGRVVVSLDGPREAVAAWVGVATGGAPWYSGGAWVARPLFDHTAIRRVIPGLGVALGGAPGWSLPGLADAPTTPGFVRGAVVLAPAIGRGGPRVVLLTANAPWLRAPVVRLGQVVSGLGVVDALAQAPRAADDSPQPAVSLQSVQVFDAPPPGAAR